MGRETDMFCNFNSGKYREDPSCRPIIRERWTNRLATVQKEPGIWQRCLKVHSLAMPPQMDVTDRVKYSRICRKAGRKDLAHKMIVRCMSGLQSDPLDLSYIVSRTLLIVRIAEVRSG